MTDEIDNTPDQQEQIPSEVLPGTAQLEDKSTPTLLIQRVVVEKDGKVTGQINLSQDQTQFLLSFAIGYLVNVGYAAFQDMVAQQEDLTEQLGGVTPIAEPPQE